MPIAYFRFYAHMCRLKCISTQLSSMSIRDCGVDEFFGDSCSDPDYYLKRLTPTSTTILLRIRPEKRYQTVKEQYHFVNFPFSLLMPSLHLTPATATQYVSTYPFAARQRWLQPTVSQFL